MQLKHRFEEVYEGIRANKLAFFVVFFIVVLLSYSVLFVVDFIPEPISEETRQAREKEALLQAARREILVTEDKITIAENSSSKEVEVTAEEKNVEEILPVRIVIEALDIDTPILNPESREVSALDNALLSGVVRHPDSADFANVGNMLILGHSSYLPNVINKNFQAFNGIQKMTWGDKIHVYSEDTLYTYRVQKVYQAKASEITVPPTPGKATLTLATCNSFGSKEDRFMVEAVLLESKDL